MNGNKCSNIYNWWLVVWDQISEMAKGYKGIDFIEVLYFAAVICSH